MVIHTDIRTINTSQKYLGVVKVDHHLSPVSEEAQNRIIKRKVKREKRES